MEDELYNRHDLYHYPTEEKAEQAQETDNAQARETYGGTWIMIHDRGYEPFLLTWRSYT